MLQCTKARGSLAFVLRLVIGYLLLLSTWYPLGNAYRGALLALGGPVASLFVRDGIATFHRYPPAKEGEGNRMADVVVMVQKPQWIDENGGQEPVVAKAISSFYQGFTPTILLAALFLATRLPWKERLVKLGLAMLGLYLFQLFTVVIDIWFTMAPRASNPEFWNWCLSLLHAMIGNWPAGVFVIPAALWVLLCFRRLKPALARAQC